MKTIKKLFFLVALSAAFVSCNLLEVPVNDVEIQSDLNLSVQNNSSGSSMLKIVAMSKTFNKAGEVNLAENADINDKLDKIKSMEITKVTLSALNFSPSETTLTGLTLSFPDLNISKTITSETAITDLKVDFTPEELNKIQTKVLGDKIIKFAVSGTVSNYPVTFTVSTKYTANFKIKLF